MTHAEILERIGVALDYFSSGRIQKGVDELKLLVKALQHSATR